MMPGRGRGNKITKRPRGSGARRGSRHSSMSSAAQEQLEQLVQQAASSTAHDAAGEKSLVSISISGSITDSNGQPKHAASADNGTGADHQMADQRPSSSSTSTSMQSIEPAQTAAEVAMLAYGNILQLDSANASCRRLAVQPAQREPVQRRSWQKLNIVRRGNVEALLAHISGRVPPLPCKSCHKGHGPWTQCVVSSGLLCGSCSNCWFNASGVRCTFHVDGNSGGSKKGANASFKAVDVDSWIVNETSKQLIQQTMGDVAGYSKRDRHLARIEAAAEELGMRIAEYEEYLRTPEGEAEHKKAIGETEETGAGGGDGAAVPAPAGEGQNSSQQSERLLLLDSSMEEAPSQESLA